MAVELEEADDEERQRLVGEHHQKFGAHVERVDSLRPLPHEGSMNPVLQLGRRPLGGGQTEPRVRTLGLKLAA